MNPSISFLNNEKDCVNLFTHNSYILLITTLHILLVPGVHTREKKIDVSNRYSSCGHFSYRTISHSWVNDFNQSLPFDSLSTSPLRPRNAMQANSCYRSPAQSQSLLIKVSIQVGLQRFPRERFLSNRKKIWMK